MGSKQIAALKPDGRMDAMRFYPHSLYSPRSNPKHPDHADWLDRTSPDDPDMILLLAAIRAHGTDEGQPVLVYLDGGRTNIACGDRRQAAVAIVNAERKAERLPPYKLRALTTGDPVLARSLENACRKGDKPMVIARRLRSNMGALATDPDRPETGLAPAASACGVTLRDARLLLKCLSLPPEIQARVGAAENGIPFDVAAGMAGDSAAALAAIDATKNLDGKVNGRKAAAVAKAARKARAPAPARAKTKPAPVLASWEAEVRASVGSVAQDGYKAVRLGAYADGLAAAQGKAPPEWAAKYHESGDAARKAAKS